MSASLDIAKLAEQILQLPDRLSANVPLIVREKGKPANDMLAKINARQLCVYVMPMFPKHAIQGASVVFFDRGELRVRVQENVKLNKYPVTAFDLIDDIAVALHWQPDNVLIPAIKAKMQELNCDQNTAKAILREDPMLKPYWDLGEILRHPLQINVNPVDSIEDPDTRILDVVFDVTYEIDQ